MEICPSILTSIILKSLISTCLGCKRQTFVCCYDYCTGCVRQLDETVLHEGKHGKTQWKKHAGKALFCQQGFISKYAELYLFIWQVHDIHIKIFLHFSFGANSRSADTQYNSRTYKDFLKFKFFQGLSLKFKVFSRLFLACEQGRILGPCTSGKNHLLLAYGP